MLSVWDMYDLNINKLEQWSLCKAAEYAYPLLVKSICDAGGEPDIRDNYGETPLLLMAHSGPWNEDPRG